MLPAERLTDDALYNALLSELEVTKASVAKSLTVELFRRYTQLQNEFLNRPSATEVAELIRRSNEELTQTLTKILRDQDTRRNAFNAGLSPYVPRQLKGR